MAILTVIVVLAGVYSLYTLTHPHHPVNKSTSQGEAAGGVTVIAGPEAHPDIKTAKEQIPSEKTETQIAADVTHIAEKPLAPATKGKAQVRFTSVPEGAAIEVDGKSSSEWVTPFAMSDLAPGTHQVVLTKTGYSPQSGALQVGRRTTTYSASLKPITTAVSVATEPKGAAIEIDGANTGAFSPAQIPVATGEHRIVVYLDGYRSASALANVNDGHIYRFAPVLNPADSRQAGNVRARLGKLWGSVPSGKGMVDFRTNPSGARISVNGHDVPIATPAHAPLAAGDYVITFREPGYKQAEKTVHVEAGKLVMVDTALDPE
jgi:hypothetical protein